MQFGTISLTIPIAGVKSRRDTFHHFTDLIGIIQFTQMKGKLFFSLKSQIIPTGSKNLHINIRSPIAPTPITRTNHRHTLAINLPDFMQILLQAVVNMRNKRIIVTIERLRVESIPAYRRKHLQRKFLTPVQRWNRRSNNAVRTLPVHQFIDTFCGQLPTARIKYIESFTQLIYFISPPLSTLTIRTVHVIIAHGNI